MPDFTGWESVRCANCNHPRGAHRDDVLRFRRCPTVAGGEFREKPGDEWCHTCDDFAVNCECDDEDARRHADNAFAASRGIDWS